MISSGGTSLRQELCPGVDIAHKDSDDFTVKLDIYHAGLLNVSADLNFAADGNRDRLVPIIYWFDCDEWRHHAIRSCHKL
jgi:hypothetical protein